METLSEIVLFDFKSEKVNTRCHNCGRRIPKRLKHYKQQKPYDAYWEFGVKVPLRMCRTCGDMLFNGEVPFYIV